MGRGMGRDTGRGAGRGMGRGMGRGRGRGGGGRGHDKGREKRRKRADSDSDSDEEDRGRKRVKNNLAMIEKASIALHKTALPGFPKSMESKLEGFKRNFWTGPLPEDIEQLKLLRKDLGLNVKGNLEVCPSPITDAKSAGLPAEFSKVFEAMNLSRPTMVQRQSWPAALSGLNLLCIAPTGSGKTLAYSLPMIPHIQSRLLDSKCKVNGTPCPMALVLVPTRELATQVNQSLKAVKRQCGITSFAVYGGEDKEKQVDDLNEGNGYHILVATPGRLIDLLASKVLTLSNVTYLVVDEADRMLALGFREQITLVCQQIYPQKQVSLFSATFPGKLREAIEEWVPSATTIRINTLEMKFDNEDANKKTADHPTAEGTAEKGTGNTEEGEATEGTAAATTATVQGAASHSLSSFTISSTVEQEVHVCSTHKKPRLLIRYLTKVREEEKSQQTRQPGLMIVFCTKIKTLKFVADFLKRQNVNNFSILHGQLPQSARERALNDFRCGKITTLVATDVAARGIDVKQLKYVVNYDFPSNLEQYCHRVGRTGRQGKQGYSYSLITRSLAPLVGDLIKLLHSCKQTIEPNLQLLAEEYNTGSIAPEELLEVEDDGEN